MSTNAHGTQESTAVDQVHPDRDITVADTGAGLLVYEVITEYRETVGREKEVARKLIGFADVSDWDAVESAVRARGHGMGDVLHLPEIDVNDLPEAAQ